LKKEKGKMGLCPLNGIEVVQVRKKKQKGEKKPTK